jgi:peptide chain release factor 2
MASPDFWNNKENAQSDVELVSELRSKIQPFQALESRAADLAVLKELAAEESPDQQAGIIAEVTSEYESLLRDLEKFELQQFLSNEFDTNPAFLTIHAGAGGTESCDWAEMLLRMYSRWIERNDLRSETVDIQVGDEAGIKSTTLRVSGDHHLIPTSVAILRLPALMSFLKLKMRPLRSTKLT